MPKSLIPTSTILDLCFEMIHAWNSKYSYQFGDDAEPAFLMNRDHIGLLRTAVADRHMRLTRNDGTPEQRFMGLLIIEADVEEVDLIIRFKNGCPRLDQPYGAKPWET